MAMYSSQHYGTKSVSQAAALALRQLQDQLSAAYSENAQLQQERADLQANMHAAADAHRCELEQSEAHAAKVTKQVTEMRGMLEEMREALQTTADENTKLSKEAEKAVKGSSSLTRDLEACRYLNTPRHLHHRQVKPLYESHSNQHCSIQYSP